MTRETFLSFSPPSIGEAEIDEVVATLRSQWITTGPRVKRFEDAFAALLGAPEALALNSATAALHVALASLRVGPGDAVITTPMTFSSSVHVIEHVGARPIFADVEPDTLNIDPVRVETAVAAAGRATGGPRVRALLPVHLYGHPCDMDALTTIAGEHRLAIVEDAAHALPARAGATWIGGDPGSAASPRLTAFSFYATKNITTGEGGMLTGSPELLKEARVWSLHGMSRDSWNRYSAEGSWAYEVDRAGFKYNMSDIQAAIGLRQLPRLDQIQARRRAIVEQYDAGLGDLEMVEVPRARKGVEHAWHLYVIRLKANLFSWSLGDDDPGVVRRRFIEELRTRNIGSSVHFIPVHLHRYYREKYGYRPHDFPVAFREFQRIVSLPLYPGMTDGDVSSVIEAVRDIVRKFKR